MKKLMIAAATAAMVGGAFASPCVDPDEPVAQCRAWDLKMTLKSLGPKKASCVTKAENPCEDDVKGMVYFMDNVTRKLTGYLWICDYTCGSDANIVLWDAKNKVAPIAFTEEAISLENLVAYGKKATKVAGMIEFAGDDSGAGVYAREQALEVVAAGVNGKMVRGVDDEDCYVKSLSGNACGLITFIPPAAKVYVNSTKGGLCVDPEEEIEICDEYGVKLLPFCEACCFEGWCDVDDWTEMVPAVGTWSMKYNKKVSKGDKTIRQLAPAYAL